jgi:hypothetical protein
LAATKQKIGNNKSLPSKKSSLLKHPLACFRYRKVSEEHSQLADILKYSGFTAANPYLYYKNSGVFYNC